MLKHSDVSDEAAQKAVEGHPAVLRQCTKVMIWRGRPYTLCLKELPKLFARVANTVCTSHTEAAGGGEALPPVTRPLADTARQCHKL